MRVGLLTAAALVVAAVALVAGDAGAAAGCTYEAGKVRVAQPPGEKASLRVGKQGAILVDGAPCGAATTANTTAIEVDGGAGSRATIDLRGGSFGGVPIKVELDGGDGELRVLGSSRDERIVVRGGTVALAGSGNEVAMESIELISLEGGGGDDELVGGNEDDVLRGGPGRDRMRGAGGADRLFAGEGRDRMWGGSGEDRLAGGAGDDVCRGGADRDRLISCAPPYAFRARTIDSATRERMSGRSFHDGCPVGLSDLRLLRIDHWGFDGDAHRGELAVHRDSVGAMRTAFRGIFRGRFPIRRMELVDNYGGDDHRSMDADNTSAFNCRFVSGTTRWSEHAYGHAIDVNPIENPYVTSSGHVSPPAGRPYADRSQDAPGMIHPGDVAARAFGAAGWKWHVSGWPKDYQHFSVSGH